LPRSIPSNKLLASDSLKVSIHTFQRPKTLAPCIVTVALDWHNSTVGRKRGHHPHYPQASSAAALFVSIMVRYLEQFQRCMSVSLNVCSKFLG
jgi:hypothetical protein